jgi:protein phosphatase
MSPAAPCAQPHPEVVENGVATHVGRVRRHNEDSFLLLPESGLWAVADGMGGHEAGLLASSTVVDVLQTIGSPTSAPDLLARFEDRVLEANARLKQFARERGGEDVIVGSTLAALLVYDCYFACLWSGDSRIYLMRKDRIVQLSKDHTEAQELVDRGVLSPEEARRWPRRNILTHALGVRDPPELYFDHGTLQFGDTFIICSDGLTSHVSDDEILSIATRVSSQAACDALIQLSLERGGTDNVTVLVIRFQSNPEMARADDARPISGQDR